VLLIAGILLLLVLGWPWGALALGLCLAGFVGELALWNRTVRRRRVQAGATATLVGATAAVVTPCRPDGHVRVEGETWSAHCPEGADAGETVVVTRVDDLTLLVERRPEA
jgi:membrane protein implicated in regulation of membrane protease activity